MQQPFFETKNIINNKWIYIGLIIVLLVILVLHIETPKITSANISESTPSSRLAGYWKDVDGNREIWYSSVDPQLKSGTYRFRKMSYEEFGPPYQFKVLKEYPSEDKVILRISQDMDLMNLEAVPDHNLSKLDVVCHIFRDRQYMTQEYVHILSGDRILMVYQYVGE